MKIFKKNLLFIAIINITNFYLIGNDFLFLEKCNISIKLNSDLIEIERTEDSIILMDNKKQDLWIFICKDNLQKTYDVKSNQVILEFTPNIIEFENIQNPLKKGNKNLQGNLELKKSYIQNPNKKNENVCQYFFGTRDHLYTLIFYNPQIDNNLENCKSNIILFLNSIYFTKIHIPITEKEYKLRLSISIIISVFIILFFIAIYFKKNKFLPIELNLSKLKRKQNIK